MKMPLQNDQITIDRNRNTPSTQSSQSSLLFDYEIQKSIGSGNFGKVKLGIYKQTNKKVAIKILSKEKIKKKNEMKIVQRELDILPSFNHVNVIHFSKCVEDSSYIYIIMDYCELGELFDYIVSKTKLSEDETAFFFYQMINGVDYIHAKGISHRDLKPENLLLTKNKLLKIIDFGLASTSSNQNILGTRCGSPSYASPELLKGRKYNGYKTDIWSCGIILYAMICGYLPFDGRNNDELFRLIIKGNVEYPSTISETVKKILKKMLVVNPDYRIAIKEIKNDSLYLKGKKIFEDQFGFDPQIESDRNIKAYTNVNLEESNLNGVISMNQEINTFRKKVNIIGCNTNYSTTITKAKDKTHKVIQSIKLNNRQKRQSPIKMLHLQTEPNAIDDSPKTSKLNPLTYFYGNNIQTNNTSINKNKREEISSKTEIFTLHPKGETPKAYSLEKHLKGDRRNPIIIHTKNKGSNNIHLNLDHDKTYNNNAIKAVNILFRGKSNDIKENNTLISRFPFQNYIIDGSINSNSKRRRIENNTFNSVSYEENQKKRIVMYKKEILPQLISNY